MRRASGVTAAGHLRRKAREFRRDVTNVCRASSIRFMRFAPCLLIVLPVGCSARSYDVTVRNDLNQPITVWLTKSGPPAEANWLSPEQMAIGENTGPGRLSGVTIPAGKIAETGKVKGKFPKGTSAILRVYVGQHTL